MSFPKTTNIDDSEKLIFNYFIEFEFWISNLLRNWIPSIFFLLRNRIAQNVWIDSGSMSNTVKIQRPQFEIRIEDLWAYKACLIPTRLPRFAWFILKNRDLNTMLLDRHLIIMIMTNKNRTITNYQT